MKKIVHMTVVLVFAAALWVPLLCTPRMCRAERKILRSVEKHDPAGTLCLAECEYDFGKWVEQLQCWYRDSFAFRSDLLAAYNGLHCLIHNYPTRFYGRDGHMFLRETVSRRLRPVSRKDVNRALESLSDLRRCCARQGTECLFVLIPAKVSAHPELAPRWFRERDGQEKRLALTALIRQSGFRVLDLVPVLQQEAQDTGQILYRKYDHHWGTEGALAAYRAMMSFFGGVLPESRTVHADRIQLVADESDSRFSRFFYLDRFCGEPLTDIQSISLPAVKVVKNGISNETSLHVVYRGGRTDVFCPDAGRSKVVFIRDSFLSLPSQLFNHSFGHTVYLNNSKEGLCPPGVIEADQPDLLVIALEEGSMFQYLAAKMEPVHGSGPR
jgi:hypothetical protein